MKLINMLCDPDLEVNDMETLIKNVPCRIAVYKVWCESLK